MYLTTLHTANQVIALNSPLKHVVYGSPHSSSMPNIFRPIGWVSMAAAAGRNPQTGIRASFLPSLTYFLPSVLPPFRLSLFLSFPPSLPPSLPSFLPSPSSFFLPSFIPCLLPSFFSSSQDIGAISTLYILRIRVLLCCYIFTIKAPIILVKSVTHL